MEADVTVGGRRQGFGLVAIVSVGGWTRWGKGGIDPGEKELPE